MATRMASFLSTEKSVPCVSGHYYDQPHPCELCQTNHATELLVVKNRGGKLLRAAVPCLKEMIRFKVCDIEELGRWLNKMKDLKVDHERRREEEQRAWTEQKKRLEKKVILRKRPSP